MKNQTGMYDPVSSAKSYSFIEAYQSDPVTFDSDIMMNMGFSVEASTMWVIEELELLSSSNPGSNLEIPDGVEFFINNALTFQSESLATFSYDK